MSDDLRPPSLRDTTRLEDVVRHHGLVLSKLAPGLFGGRSRIPDPLDFADDLAADGDPGGDGDTDEPEWWDEDRYTATGAGVITWTLTYAPVPESLSITWCGVSLIRPEDFTLGDDGQTVTIPDQGFHAQDLFAAQYQFLDVVNDDPPPPVPASLLLVGYTVIGNTASQIALPAGWQAGDLFTLAMGTGLLAGSVPTCPDSRIVASATQTAGHCYAGFGVLDGSGSPISISISDGEGNGKVLLTVYRTTGSLVHAESTGSSEPLAPTMPAGTLDMAILVTDNAGEFGPTDGTSGWTRDTVGNGSGQHQASWSDQTSPAAFSYSSTDQWAAVVIGLTGG